MLAALLPVGEGFPGTRWDRLKRLQSRYRWQRIASRCDRDIAPKILRDRALAAKQAGGAGIDAIHCESAPVRRILARLFLQNSHAADHLQCLLDIYYDALP